MNVPHTINSKPTSKHARRSAVRPLEPFESVVERHGLGLLRFCIARLGPDRGEEACQEALIAAMRHYDELKDRGAVGGWLFSIAQRKIIDAARSSARSPIASDRLEEHSAVWHDRDHAGEIWSQVATLPPKQREAVALRYLADLSHAEIAEVMATTVEAARRNVFEGLKRLRRDLPDDPNRR
jgi:RNA polymerase sigma factor (sigma-70 family)